MIDDGKLLYQKVVSAIVIRTQITEVLTSGLPQIRQCDGIDLSPQVQAFHLERLIKTKALQELVKTHQNYCR